MTTGRRATAPLSMLAVAGASYARGGGGLSVEEVARAVGLTSTKTMTRALKRIEGVTPGRYRGLGRLDARSVVK